MRACWPGCHRTALSAMFPCEMARYIAGFRRYARKLARIRGYFRGNEPGSTRLEASPGGPEPDRAQVQNPTAARTKKDHGSGETRPKWPSSLNGAIVHDDQ